MSAGPLCETAPGLRTSCGRPPFPDQSRSGREDLLRQRHAREAPARVRQPWHWIPVPAQGTFQWERRGMHAASPGTGLSGRWSGAGGQSKGWRLPDWPACCSRRSHTMPCLPEPGDVQVRLPSGTTDGPAEDFAGHRRHESRSSPATRLLRQTHGAALPTACLCQRRCWLPCQPAFSVVRSRPPPRRPPRERLANQRAPDGAGPWARLWDGPAEWVARRAMAFSRSQPPAETP